MALPDFQSLMLPLLRSYADGETRSIASVSDSLGREFMLTEDELRQLLPSGRQSTFRNRIAWARTYLSKAGLLASPKRAHFHITEAGLKTLAAQPTRIDINYLNAFPEFLNFRTRKHADSPADLAATAAESARENPEELIESLHDQLKRALADDLLARISTAAPDFFERLVVELLLKMGYGGSRQDAGRAIGRSGDGGIDGIINEDRLGLDSIYLQAKRWENPVGRPEIQKFAGALAEHRAKKGVFITTSSFTKEALASATKHDARIVLIDGEKLATLMIDHGLGVTLAASYDVKRVDSDYFVDE
jgi:restriction system protein